MNIFKFLLDKLTKCQILDLEQHLAQDYNMIAPWILEGDSRVLAEENRLLRRFEESGRE